jgi:DNA-binding XRE family transcriptional regulator
MSEKAVPPASTTEGGGIPEWDLADRMKKALRHSGVGAQEMADYLGVSRQSVGNWINGRVTPSTQTLRLWALRCGVPLEWLRPGLKLGVKMRCSWTSGHSHPLGWLAAA